MRKSVNPFLKFIFFFIILFSLQQTNAQDIVAKQNALTLIHQNAVKLGLSQEDENNFRISDVYVDNLSGALLVYIQQTYKGVDVYNTLQVAAFKNNELISLKGSRIEKIEKLVNSAEAKPAVLSSDAVKAAANHLGLGITQPLAATTDKLNSDRLSFGKLGISKENVTARKLWVPSNDGSKVQLAWQISINPNKSSDYWLIKVDALNGTILGKENLTVSCNWDKPRNTAADFYKVSENQKEDNQSPSASEPEIVNSAGYNVVAYPAEAPTFPGGYPSLQTDPWNLAGAGNNATSLKWNFNGTTYYDETRGNNVYAGTDTDANNVTDMTAQSLTPEPNLSFNYIPDFSKQPYTPNNRNVAMTNLFYWNNILHDISYQYGFDEVSGNFQSNNQGRGGIGNDFVYADAQDGSGTDNSNFSTPADGSNPRMQMYLFGGNSLTVNSPSSIAGSFNSVESRLSTNNLIANVGPLTADVALYNDDAAGTGHGACIGAANKAALTGKIALIYRGNCTFVIKIKNAQNAGAVGVIMVDSVAGESPIIMGGTDNSITIPAVMISKTDGNRIKAALTGSTVNATFAKLNIDGDLDAGIICHEYTHGISNRLTGGPSNVSCLSNAEQMGEGWSDIDALIITTNWSTALVTDGGKPRSLGTYALGQNPSQLGIRTYPYSSELDINPWTYDSLPASAGEPHLIGEIWCNTLWAMTWNIIKTDGINTNLFNAGNKGGNTVALKLIYEGLKLQKCSPGFIDGRNGILAADTLLYGGKYSCSIWNAFADRGMGVNASEGRSTSYTDQTTDYNLPNACKGLPVTWGSFTAVKSGSGALLNWSTLQETNSSKYIIQRSNDGQHFENIGTVSATGASSVVSKYNFTDARPLNGIDFYRLQQFDKNGSYVYSEIRTLNFNLPKSIIISPNPAKDILNITITGNTDALKLYLVNSEGKTVKQYNMSSQESQLNLPTVSKGVYYLKIISPDGSATSHKIIIE